MKFASIIFSFLLTQTFFAQTKAGDSLKHVEVAKLNIIQDSLCKFGYPLGSETVEVIKHKAMIIGYSCTEKLPAWVYHLISPEINSVNVGRTNNFRKDPFLKCIVGGAEDYSKTVIVEGKKKSVNLGYDRGHLAPSADFRWSKTALSESFYYSNMTAQRPDFNRVSWNSLEELIRSAVRNQPANYYVVTGPVLCDYSGVTDGINDIPVPNYFFKAIIRLDKTPMGIGFIMPNEKCDKNLRNYVVTIDEIEQLIGFDLFPDVEKNIQDKIEGSSNYDDWFLKR
ncbi:MAG TPA: DNA/RNA non-specific endonuclease [Crocinitomicaceae bacterium]|nr:DNA/RNA non-specific endonuclease [Crocinitomicaceae bacterium]